mgnify:CR=1 FL=1
MTAAVEADKRWHCDGCNKVIAEKRGVGTVITCKCGHVNG